MLRQVRTNVDNQIELTALRDELTTINQTLQAMALLDSLTGLANRRQFDLFLAQSLKRSALTGKPVALIAHTVKGKGVSFMEDDNNWHYRAPTAEEVVKSFKELGLS